MDNKMALSYEELICSLLFNSFQLLDVAA